MIRVATFIDLASLENQYKRLGLELDLTRLKDELVNPTEGRYDIGTFVYDYFPNREIRYRIDYHNQLRLHGFMISSKEVLRGKGKKKSFNPVELAVDALSFCLEAKPDVFLLISSRAHFGHLLEKIRQRGVRVEVAGFLSHLPHELKVSASTIIDLTQLQKLDEENQIKLPGPFFLAESEPEEVSHPTIEPGE